MFDDDPIPHGPAAYGNIDDAEFLSEEVRPADLVSEALEILDPLAEGGGLKLGGLSVEEAEVARDDELVDEVDPDPGLGSDVRIGGYQVGLLLGISVLEELEDDMGVVEGPPLVREGRDKTFGIESYTSVVRRVKGTEISGWGKRGVRQV